MSSRTTQAAANAAPARERMGTSRVQENGEPPAAARCTWIPRLAPDVTRELRRPPDPVADPEGERRYEDGAHEERVEQDAEGDDEADLGEEDQREDGEGDEGSGEHDAGRGDDRAGDREAAKHAFARAVGERLLAHPGHQEDV